MKGIQIKFKKIFNWGSESNIVRVRLQLDQENILFDDAIEGQKSKNILKLNATLPLFELSGE